MSRSNDYHGLVYMSGESKTTLEQHAITLWLLDAKLVNLFDDLKCSKHTMHVCGIKLKDIPILVVYVCLTETHIYHPHTHEHTHMHARTDTHAGLTTTHIFLRCKE